MQSWLEGRIWVGECAQATGMTASLRILSSKADSNTCESFTRSRLKLESVHQESPRSDVFRKRATKPLMKQKHCQKHLTWAVEKKNWTVAQWSKVLFSYESKFCFSFGSQGLESGGRVERHRIQLLEVQCEVSTVSDDLGCRDVCWHWSIVFYQVQSQCSRLPGDFRALYASRIDFKVLLLVYKSLNGLGPKYIADMLTEYKPNRPLRSLGSSQLEIPRVHTKQGESAFSYYAARSWNQLPEEIRCAKTLATFKSSLKTHLFSCAFVEWALCYVWTDCIVFYV